ncbi:MAG TPA: hypothetical protein PK640_04585 [Verrucomicrobiota bacterium]|nr:hypothetical protein [Verrucomicrobiota bacterium]
MKPLNVSAPKAARYAVMLYSEPRWTKDLDLWIALDPPNARAIFGALREFGAPLAGLTEQDFSAPGCFYQNRTNHTNGRDGLWRLR